MCTIHYDLTEYTLKEMTQHLRNAIEARRLGYSYFHNAKALQAAILKRKVEILQDSRILRAKYRNKPYVSRKER